MTRRAYLSFDLLAVVTSLGRQRKEETAERRTSKEEKKITETRKNMVQHIFLQTQAKDLYQKYSFGEHIYFPLPH